MLVRASNCLDCSGRRVRFQSKIDDFGHPRLHNSGFTSPIDLVNGALDARERAGEDAEGIGLNPRTGDALRAKEYFTCEKSLKRPKLHEFLSNRVGERIV